MNSGDWLGPAWEEEEPSAPYERLDLCPPEPARDEAGWLPELPVEPCPCCGAEVPADCACPCCGWLPEPQTCGEEETGNYGLSLEQARLNFQVFGCIAPWLLSKEEKEQEPDA